VRIPPGHGRLSLCSVVCCQVEVSAKGLSLVQRNPTEYVVSNECDREAPLEEAMARSRVEATQKTKYSDCIYNWFCLK
jgi:hypothetical protein